MGAIGLDGACENPLEDFSHAFVCGSRGCTTDAGRVIALLRPILVACGCGRTFDLRRRICALKFPPQPHGGMSCSQVQDRPPPCGSLFSGTFHALSLSLSHTHMHTPSQSAAAVAVAGAVAVQAFMPSAGFSTTTPSLRQVQTRLTLT